MPKAPYPEISAYALMKEENAMTSLLPFNASQVAQYYLAKCSEVGELIGPLKMQKLIYYAYAWSLVKNDVRLFDEPIEAWPNGPVVPSLYRNLKGYGSTAIGDDFVDNESVSQFLAQTSPEVIGTVDKVLQAYVPKSAFELVALTHSEKPWKQAREGLAPTEASSKPLSDADIIAQFSK
jgi:uncharacterized phage-associated protein